MYPNKNYNRFSPKNQIRANHRIRATEVRVIGPDGQQVGVMAVSNALKLAQQQGLDLVEVAPEARPPVCRIIDFGKYRYEQSKKTKGDKNTSASKLKEIKFHVNIGDNDYQIKLRHASDFLQKNMRVKASIAFRGREMAHKEFGMQLVHRFIQDLATYGHTDTEPRLMGKNLHVILVPGKAKPKPASEAPRSTPASSSTSAPVTPPPPSQTKSNSSGFGTTIKIDLKPGS